MNASRARDVIELKFFRKLFLGTTLRPLGVLEGACFLRESDEHES